MSDRVRYYLENSVKEIKDLKDRGIFEQKELSQIMKRRTDFEHKLLSRTVQPQDFINYAEFENKLDRLRQLRIQRLKLGNKKSVSDYAGRRRIVFTLERGTKKFPASLKLWIKLVEYAHKHQSVNVVKKALAQILQTHPRDPEVWVYVAKFQVEENSSVPEGRAVLQRGLRFNPESQFLWLEYMRLELIYVAKILARRKILGLTKAKEEEQIENRSNNDKDKDNDSTELTSKDLEAATEIKNLPEINIDLLGDPDSNPALRGDVALAVYDAALSQFSKSDNMLMEFGFKTLALFDEFSGLKRGYLCTHVLETLPVNAETEFMQITLPIRHSKVASPEFPDQLRQVFNLFTKSTKSPQLKDKLQSHLLEQVVQNEEANENLRKACELFLNKMHQ